MKRVARYFQPSVLITLVASVVLLAAGFWMVRADINEMRAQARENILWDATQLELEFLRLQRSLAEFQTPGSLVTPKEVNVRFDILWSRLVLFEEGNIGLRMRAYDEPTGALSSLFASVRAVESEVVNLKAGDTETAKAVANTLAPHALPVRKLMQVILHGEEKINAVLRDHLAQFSMILTLFSGFAVLISVLLIYVFARDRNRFQQLAESNLLLLAAANKASRAKSQFLAMMSHELRTPMNGVLGHLALVKQGGLSIHQDRLLEQAERSGQQMIGLLGDILDFAALQDDRLKLENKPFDPRLLAESVREMFEPVAAREGIEFSVRIEAECPSRVIGDFARLRQALTHLATYILETAGTRNIGLGVGYRDGNLLLSIAFEYDRAGAEWRPELITGEKGAREDAFASEALGPSVSRGLIERMGGQTKLDNPAPSRIAVLVEVPAREIVVETLLIRVFAQSASLEAICKASFQSEKVRFLCSEDKASPHVIMIEAGGEAEHHEVARASQAYPEAVLVAIGRPVNPDDFDDVVNVPIDLHQARAAKFLKLASGARDLASGKDLRYSQRNTT